MKITERSIAVLLSDDGREVLQSFAIGISESATLWVYAEDSDDMGLWIRIEREDGDHPVLIRWEYVLAMDFPAGQPKTVGIR